MCPELHSCCGSSSLSCTVVSDLTRLIAEALFCCGSDAFSESEEGSKVAGNVVEEQEEHDQSSSSAQHLVVAPDDTAAAAPKTPVQVCEVLHRLCQALMLKISLSLSLVELLLLLRFLIICSGAGGAAESEDSRGSSTDSGPWRT